MAEFLVCVEATVWFDVRVEADSYAEAYSLAVNEVAFEDFVLDEGAVDYTNRVLVYDEDGNDVEFREGEVL